ncbi:hypothetical protein CU098_006417 [Rhizopus stolonifer]|uniref:Uncharacterized protein n=1 Tax=Rhizopus stolonifer TaxID=4846 RepID=A0A367J2S2_RHIST|nr:hypothetical protein CU098_006417 [Rhizopus stolonifer]
MTKRKSKSENTYSIWLESASKLVPPYDYFAFAELANNSEPLTNSSYHQLLLKALSQANMTNTNNITSAINKYKSRNIIDSAFNKKYTEYWNARSSSVSNTHLREESASVIKEVQDSIFSFIRKRIKTTPASEDDASEFSSNNQDTSTEEFDIANHLNEGNLQFKLFTGSSLINLDDKRLVGLVNEEILKEIKVDTNLPPFQLSEAATTLLAKIGESVPSSRKLRGIIRKNIGENDDFDLMEMYDINFIETLSNHYLNLMDSPLSPLLGTQLERTAAVNTTIIILNILFIDVNDVIGFKWYEVRTHMTENQKWDGVGFSVKDKKLTPVLIEFSGGIGVNNNATKQNQDVVKLTSACKRSIDYITATTDLTEPVPEYVVRFYGTKIVLVGFIWRASI